MSTGSSIISYESDDESSSDNDDNFKRKICSIIGTHSVEI